MKSILLSIKPEQVANVLNGKQTIIVRKKFPKDYVGWVYIYCTKDNKHCLIDNLNYSEDRYITACALSPDRKVLKDFILNGKVVARFWCDKVERHFEEEKETYIQRNCVYAIHISKLEVFEKPREVWEFYCSCEQCGICGKYLPKRQCDKCRLTKAPQNYCYIESEKELENGRICNYTKDSCDLSLKSGISNIYIDESIKDLHIHYKGKEYVFDLEKALTLLCKELEK